MQTFKFIIEIRLKKKVSAAILQNKSLLLNMMEEQQLLHSHASRRNRA